MINLPVVWFHRSGGRAWSRGRDLERDLEAQVWSTGASDGPWPQKWWPSTCLSMCSLAGEMQGYFGAMETVAW